MKLTKNEATAKAKQLAKRDASVAGYGVTELAGLDWTERRRQATLAARTNAELAAIDTRDAYKPDCEEAFVSEAMNLWYGKEKVLDRARAEWKRALAGKTVDQAKAEVRATLESMKIRGAAISEYGDRVEVERGRCSATLYFRFERVEGETTNPDNAGQRAYRYKIRAEYSTSGTTWTPAEMATVVRIQSELLAAGDELTVLADRWDVVSVWGVPTETEGA